MNVVTFYEDQVSERFENVYRIDCDEEGLIREFQYFEITGLSILLQPNTNVSYMEYGGGGVLNLTRSLDT